MTYWIEKYHPVDIKDYENKEYYKLFYNFKNIKNLLIYGDSGTGKTTFINLLTIKYFKKGLKDDDVFFLNADERGISVVRNKIKLFCQKKINQNNFKMIIIDECDSLTIDAQMSLRKILEDYSNTKFVLICNYQEKIINPIVSRCVIVKFKKYTNKYIMYKCLNILKTENILISDNKEMYIQYINDLINLGNNDIRRIINNLQYITMMKLNKYDNTIINNLYGILSTDLLSKILDKIDNVINIKDTIKLLSFYNIDNIINCLIDIIVENNNFNNDKKKKLIDILSFIDSIKSKNIDYEIILYKIIKEYIYLKLN